MAVTSRAIIALPALIMACAALASCGGERGANSGGDGTTGAGANVGQAGADDIAATGMLFSDNFKGVCSGASVSRAAAYDPQRPAHKALYFATYKDDFSDRSDTLPDDWTVQFSPGSDALQAVDLVACARRTAAREVRVCDGFRSNGRDTQNRVRWHTATYELSVREANTGRELAKATIEATDSDCPMFMNFSSESEMVDGYASLSDSAVADFLRPHITR